MLESLIETPATEFSGPMALSQAVRSISHGAVLQSVPEAAISRCNGESHAIYKLWTRSFAAYFQEEGKYQAALVHDPGNLLITGIKEGAYRPPWLHPLKSLRKMLTDAKEEQRIIEVPASGNLIVQFDDPQAIAKARPFLCGAAARYLKLLKEEHRPYLRIVLVPPAVLRRRGVDSTTAEVIPISMPGGSVQHCLDIYTSTLDDGYARGEYIRHSEQNHLNARTQ